MAVLVRITDCLKYVNTSNQLSSKCAEKNFFKKLLTNKKTENIIEPL